MNLKSVFFILLLIFSFSFASSLNLTSWNNILNKYVSKGTIGKIDLNLVDYSGIYNDKGKLNDLKKKEK